MDLEQAVAREHTRATFVQFLLAGIVSLHAVAVASGVWQFQILGRLLDGAAPVRGELRATDTVHDLIGVAHGLVF
ncbi:MAG TPA: hypothetical protein VFO85_01335, partial [Vicinamibacteria bacterium]|nr:hypothetical protein [Vicinamibacteria bacterium]